MVEALYLVRSTPLYSQADAWIAPTDTPGTNAKQPTAKAASQPAAEDTVTLSVGAQAHQLQQQGNSVAQIAVVLHISIAAADSYLGITEAASPATPVAIPSQLPFGPPNTLPLAKAS